MFSSPKIIGGVAIIGLIAATTVIANQHPEAAPVIPRFDPALILSVLAAIILGLAAIATFYAPAKYRWFIPALALALATPLALSGFWPDTSWGISDWDYYFSYHHVVRNLVLEHGAVPDWNPYICGGTAALADPEFPLFAPTFLLELLFGVPAGLRIAAIVITAFGGLGMVLLGRRLGLKPAAALLAAVAFALGSVNLLEIVEGHPNVFSASYVPWVIWAWLSAYQAPSKASRRLWSLACGLLLTLMFFHGGIYMLMYVGAAFLFLTAALHHRRSALAITLTASSWAVALAAIKLIPAILWLRQFQDAAYASSASLLASLPYVLLGRFLHGSTIIPQQGGGWHEYGAYIGPFVVALAALGLIRYWRRPAIRTLALGAFLALLLASSGPILKPFFDQAPWLPRSNISRIIILAILPISLLAGFGIQSLLPSSTTPRRQRWARLSLAAAIITLTALDLTSLSQALSQQTFVLEPVSGVSPAPAPIAYTMNQHETRVAGVEYTRAYANTRAGYGTLAYCSVLGPDPAVRVIEDPEGSPYLTLTDPASSARLQSWEPDQVKATVHLAQPADLIVNSNYASGWQVTVGSSQPTPALNIAGRLAASLPAGDHQVTFSYHTPGSTAGSSITIMTLTAATLVTVRSIRSTRRLS